MASVTNIFLSKANLEAASCALRDLFGTAPSDVSDQTGRRLRWRLLDHEIVAFDDHGLENDGKLDFERYPVEIDLIPLNDSKAESQLGALGDALGCYLGAALAGKLAGAALVTRDLQKEVARFG